MLPKLRVIQMVIFTVRTKYTVNYMVGKRNVVILYKGLLRKITAFKKNQFRQKNLIVINCK